MTIFVWISAKSSDDVNEKGKGTLRGAYCMHLFECDPGNTFIEGKLRL